MKRGPLNREVRKIVKHITWGVVGGVHNKVGWKDLTPGLQAPMCWLKCMKHLS